MADLNPASALACPDASNPDWPKRTFDWPEVRTVEQLRESVFAMKMTIPQFKASPMVKNLEDPFYLDLIARL